MRFELETLDRWTAERRFRVERDRLRAYAAATNETTPAFVAGDLAPPVFAILPAWERSTPRPRRRPGGEPARGSCTASRTCSCTPSSGPEWSSRLARRSSGCIRSRRGRRVIVKIETRDSEGALVNEQYVTEFFRGIEGDEGGGRPAPDHRAPEGLDGKPPIAEVTYRVDDDQTFRYADASGDRIAIHLDDEAARAVGLPGTDRPRALRDGLRGAGGARGRRRRWPGKRAAARGAILGARSSPANVLTTRIWAIAPIASPTRRSTMPARP